jgi:hypothetical protein
MGPAAPSQHLTSRTSRMTIIMEQLVAGREQRWKLGRFLLIFFSK